MAQARRPQRIRNFAQTAVYTLVFIAILGAINFLANRYNASYDSTENQLYTLSEQTQRIAGDLDQELTIAYWDRPEFFPSAEDLLERYALLSPNVIVEYHDIDRERTEAIAAGVNVQGQIFVTVGNRTEEAGGLTEQEVTGAMVRAIQGGDRIACFATGYGEGDTTNAEADGYSSALQWTAANNYQTRVIPLIPDPAIPEDCTLVILAGPKRDYQPDAVAAIKDYVEGGGRALIMVDPPIQFGSPIDENQALMDVLADWGVTVNRDLVVDLSSVGQIVGGPVITGDGFSRHAIVSQMGNLAAGMPLPRSLEISGAENDLEELLTTSPDVVTTTDLESGEIQIDQAQTGPRVLAVAGTYTSESEAVAESDAAAKGDDENSPMLAGNGHFVVVGTSRWASNGALRFNGNGDLFLNMLNWLSSDENLISIRPKDPEDRRLNMNAAQLSLLFYGSVLFLPLLMVAAGVSVWWRRR